MHNSLVKDIRDLNIKLSDVRVENLFLKLAQGSNEFFSDWLFKNKNIRTALGDPNVYDALSWVIMLTKQKDVGIAPTKQQLAIHFMNKGSVSSHIFETAVALAYFVSNDNFPNVLGGLKDILISLYSLYSTDEKEYESFETTVNFDTIGKDLQKIAEQFKSFKEQQISLPYTEQKKKKKPRKTKKYLNKVVFVDLLRKFTDTIEKAVRDLGESTEPVSGHLKYMKTNADQILLTLNRGVLANPVEMSKVFPIKAGYSHTKIATIIVSDLAVAENMAHYNFEVIKRSAMSFANISEFQKVNLDPSQDFEFDLSSLIEDPEDEGVMKEPSFKFRSIPVEDLKWLDPNVISLVSHVLFVLYKVAYP